MLGRAHMQARLIVGEYSLGGRRQLRLGRRVAGAAGIADRRTAQLVAVIVGLQRHLVGDARVGAGTFVVQRDRFTRADEEHGVLVDAHVLQAKKRVVAFGDSVGIYRGRGAVVGVKLDAERAAFQRAVGVLDFVGVESVGNDRVGRAHRSGIGGAQRGLDPVFAVVLGGDLRRLLEGAGVEPGAGAHRRRPGLLVPVDGGTVVE